MTAHVGQYTPPPAGLVRPRVGVPKFKITDRSLEGGNFDEVAADQLTTLASLSDRFVMIERTQLDHVLDEQALEGIVKAEELAKTGAVRGVDYLFLGKITNFRAKAEKSSRGFGLGKIPIPGADYFAGFDFKKKSSKITVECGVDLRLVDPTSGTTLAAHFGEYKRTDSIGAIGIEILGVGATADAELRIDDNNRGKILRLALDEALRKMLPKVDRALMARSQAAKTTGGAPSGATKNAPAGNAGFCPNCGNKLGATTKFCSGCGKKVSR